MAMDPAHALAAAFLSKQYSDAAFLAGTSVAESRSLCEKAVQIADEAVRVDPSIVHCHTASCVARGRLALFTDAPRPKVALAKEALDACQVALALAPTDDMALHLQGKWHQEMAGMNFVVRAAANWLLGADFPQGTYVDALRCFQEASTQRPDRTIHWVELARTHSKLGQWGAAQAQLEKALECPIEDINAHLQKEEAQRLLKQVQAHLRSGTLLG